MSIDDATLAAPIANQTKARTEVYKRIEAEFEGILADYVLYGISRALKPRGIHSIQFCRYLTHSDVSRTKYAQAREFRADLLADDIIDIADTEKDALCARNQIDARKWVASKLQPRVYGDKLELNVTERVDLGGALAEARQRLVQAIDIPRQLDSGTTDASSVAKPKGSRKRRALVPEEKSIPKPEKDRG